MYHKIKDFLKSLTVISFIKFFFVGLVCQFMFHTFVTYIIHVPDTGIYSVIRMRKEFLVIALGLWSIYKLYIEKTRQSVLLQQKRLAIIIVLTIISILISFATSLIIHHQSVVTFALSAKFNYFPIIILIVGWLVALHTTTQERDRSMDYIILIIKYVIIFSVLRYCFLHMFPNWLDWIGYSQPGQSIEWTANTPPPSLWLTEFYTGYVRNQWPFGGPLSLGFYMVCFFPLFYSKVLYKKKFADVWHRWLLYSFTTISTFSRAARIMWLVQLLLIAAIVYRRYIIPIIVWLCVTVGWIIGYAVVNNKTDIFLRTWSDKGHEKFLNEGLRYVKDNRLRGKGAASVGPASYHNDDGAEAFNTENQYMQVWIEYGLIGFLSRLALYIIIALLSWRRRWAARYGSQVLTESHLVRAWPFISLAALSIGGMALHPLTDSSSMYPFMMMLGLSLGGWALSSPTPESWKKKETTTLTKQWAKWDKRISLGKYCTFIILFFFIIQTQVVNGWWLFSSSLIMSSMRDIAFLGVAGSTFFIFRRYLVSFIRIYKYFLLIIVCLFLWAIIGWYIHSSTAIYFLAGVKFDLSYLVLLTIGLWWGHCIGQSIGGHWYLSSFFQWLWKVLPWIVLGGIVWQGAKLLWPDFFIQYGWYWWPGDFAPWSQPPLYYITGPGGIPRLSALFVWPNTFWFFLILFGGAWLYRLRQQEKRKLPRIIAALGYLVCIIATLSRSAVLAVTVQALVVVTFLPIMQWWQIVWNKLRPYLFKRLAGVVVILSLSAAVIVFMNQWKNTSNSERMSSLEQSYTLLTRNPRTGYGPGHVWPARHYHPDYALQPKNTLALVENIYMQIWINLWLPGIIWWWVLWLILLSYVRKIMQTAQETWSQKQRLTHYLTAMGIGLVSLLMVGWFLDIFIDSMVNYLFFILFGILIGSLHKNNKHSSSIMSINRAEEK